MDGMDRYQRQTRLSGFGSEGQEKLAVSSVLIVGLGGLGIPVAQYLNAMGVGTLGLVEQDIVELHNLQRQPLYTEADVGKPKIKVAHQRLKAQNSTTLFKLYDTFLVKENALGIIEAFDVVVDATDNFATRYLINDACVLLKKPFVYGALHGFEGQVSVFNYKSGPTYRCLFPNMPKPEAIPNCDVNGVLGVVPGIVGTLQALETVKIITGIGVPLSGSLLLFDGLQQTQQKISFNVNPENKSIRQLQDSYGASFCDASQTISVEDFYQVQQKNKTTFLIDVRTPKEFATDRLAGSINIPLQVLDGLSSDRLNAETIYLICQSGKRSGTALKILQEKFPTKSFYHILGGINQMKQLCR